ncbi:MAG TPA: prolyl oligopeptidase family serine peptidase [Gemmataceae bacterium]|nr:prolyl oligopeptidase family serine peptidase [Gemmataceae bacterium]
MGTTPPKEPGEAAANDAAFAPMVEVQEEDYAQARSRFQTKLTRKGPSPQEWARATPPAGVTEVEYASGKLRLKAWVNRPADETRKHSAVLFLHGGFAFGLDDWEISQPYRAAGFVVLTPLLRGENGQAGAYSFYYDEVDDVLAAAEYLSKLPYVKADRLYIAGPSAGGTLVLLTAMASKRFRAATSFSGITDQVLFCKHAKNAARDVPVDLTDLRELQLRSPLAYATSFKCPARIYYGTQEPHLHGMSQRTAALAKRRGLNVEAIQVEGDHSTSVPLAIKQSIAFFQKN